MLNGPSKPDPHVIRDAGFAGGIDHARRKLRHEHARFHADAAFESAEPAGFPKFFQTIEHVEVHDTGGGEAVLPGQHREMGRGIAVSVVRKERVAMQIDIRPRGRPLGVRTDVEQRLAALGGIKTVEGWVHAVSF